VSLRSARDDEHITGTAVSLRSARDDEHITGTAVSLRFAFQIFTVFQSSSRSIFDSSCPFISPITKVSSS